MILYARGTRGLSALSFTGQLVIMYFILTLSIIFVLFWQIISILFTDYCYFNINQSISAKTQGSTPPPRSIEKQNLNSCCSVYNALSAFVTTYCVSIKLICTHPILMVI